MLNARNPTRAAVSKSGLFCPVSLHAVKLSRLPALALILAFTLAGEWAFSQSPPADTAKSPVAASAELRAEALVKTIQNIRVPAGAEGRITELAAIEGANVEPGDLLALVDDTQAQLALNLRKAEEREAELNALNDVNIRDAISSERLAQAEAEAFKELRAQGATPHWEMMKKVLEADRAKLRIELAELQEKIAKVQYVGKRAERELAEYELSRRRIVAPFGGFVENRIAQLGEWVQAGTPIVQLVQLDKLRVEGDIDALRYPGQITRGTPAKVRIYANTRRSDGSVADTVEVEGRIGFVSSEIDFNHRHRVWVEIENQKVGDEWVFKPGMEAEIVVYPSGIVN